MSTFRKVLKGRSLKKRHRSLLLEWSRLLFPREPLERLHKVEILWLLSLRLEIKVEELFLTGVILIWKIYTWQFWFEILRWADAEIQGVIIELKRCPKNGTLLKFACITLITTACVQAEISPHDNFFSTNSWYSWQISSYVADGVLWRLVVYLLLCIWGEPDKLVTQWRGRLFLNCCEETPTKKIFQDHVLDPRPVNGHSTFISLIIKWSCWYLSDLAHPKTTSIWCCTIHPWLKGLVNNQIML